MSSFLLAVQFLTIIPCGKKEMPAAKMAEAAVYFPAVGLLAGVFLAAINLALSHSGFPAIATSALIIVIAIILTGGLHADGLADTFDALASGKTKEEMLVIMRDPHIGVMGTLAVLCDILLKISFLAALDTPARNIALLLMCGFSRWSLVAAMRLAPYARENGKAKAFWDGLDAKKTVLASGFMLVILCGVPQGLAPVAVAGMIGYMFIRRVRQRLGGITGDTLGALNEITEVALLAAICILSFSMKG